ncbi:MAG: lysophospholipase [Actinomycetota bacterium]
MADPFMRAWDAADPKGAVALVHGMAEHSGRYDYVGSALAAAGYSVRAVDIRGHGSAEGWPGQVAGAADWHEDTEAALRAAGAGAPGAPLFLMGHSLGSVIAASYVAKHSPAIAGLVLTGYAGLPGTALLAAMGNPDEPSIPVSAISRDPEIVKAYEDDPLVFFREVPVETNAAAMEAAIGANQGAGSITMPVLMAHGTEDQICDIEGARDFHAALGSDDKELLVYDGLYHEVLNEPERDTVIADVVAWLDRHVAGGSGG